MTKQSCYSNLVLIRNQSLVKFNKNSSAVFDSHFIERIENKLNYIEYESTYP